MRFGTTLTLLISSALLAGAAAAQAPPAGMADADDVLTSTEDWTDADVDDDGTLSQAELNRAEPRLAAYFREIDANGDWRISRDEIAAWQSGPEPSDVDADELPAGAVDAGEAQRADEDSAATAPSEGDTTRGQKSDDLLPDDGDKATELLPDDADDDATGAGEVEREGGDR
jgi:hypothetical protein